MAYFSEADDVFIAAVGTVANYLWFCFAPSKPLGGDSSGWVVRWCAIFFIGLLAPVVLSALKKWTNQACPWSLSDFGGTLPYVHLLDPRPWAARSQACWPAGHAAVGLSMLVVSFVGGWPRALWRDEATLAAPRSPWISAGAFAAYAVELSMALGFS